MKILMILQTDFPPDIRVEKEIKALIAAGHEVHLVCKNQKGRTREERDANFCIHRLSPLKSLSNKLRYGLMLPVSQNPFWRKRVRQVIQQYNIDAIHVHDLPLVPLGVTIGKKFNIPVIFDMHENYPAALKAWKKRGLEKLLKSSLLAKWVEKKVLRQVTKIIVVVEEQKERLIKAGVSPQKIAIVSNTVDLERFSATNKSLQIRKKLNADFILTYAGGIDENRGLETLINGFSIVNKKLPSAKLVIIGEGRSLPRLEKMVMDKGLEDLVDFPGWIDFEQLPDWIAASDVCLIPQPANDHANTTIPHKIFQYMALGKPVITSNARPLVRIVEECNCGAFFKSGSPEDLGRVIERIYHSKEKYGENGKKSVYDKYNWEKTAQELIKVYNNLIT